MRHTLELKSNGIVYLQTCPFCAEIVRLTFVHNVATWQGRCTHLHSIERLYGNRLRAVFDETPGVPLDRQRER